MKKKVLFVYYDMSLGGSTTSLLSLFNELDYEKYDVDLLLYKNQGELLSLIPTEINLLDQAYVPHSKFKKGIQSIFNGTLIRAYFHGFKYAKKLICMDQSMAYCQVEYCRKIEQVYDVAIGYMELWADAFTNTKVNAKKKISWIHTDYKKANLYPQIDLSAFSKSTYIVNVSHECCNSFKEMFPTLAEKVEYVPNILSEKIVLQRACEYSPDLTLDTNILKLLTVCRLDNTSKAIDRGINIVKKLIDKGYKLKWCIIGDGKDKKNIEEQILQLGLTSDVILLGAKENPYPYFKLFDAFMLISKFEGKPMSITEAQILGLPVIVTNYNSAYEQVESGIDGIICENNEEAIFTELCNLLSDPSKLKKMKANLKDRKYGNESDIDIVQRLIDN